MNYRKMSDIKEGMMKDPEFRREYYWSLPYAIWMWIRWFWGK